MNTQTPNLTELKQQHKVVLDEAEAMLGGTGHVMSEADTATFNYKMSKAKTIEGTIAAREKMSTIRSSFSGGRPSFPSGAAGEGARTLPMPTRVLQADYAPAFHDYMSSNGQKVSAALYEGTGASGGFIVPVIVEGTVVPLAPPDMGVRSIATILPTSSDIKIPVATTISTATGKAEGDGTGTNLFQESEPALAQFTLSAFMMGVLHQISWELAQDVPSFQAFAISDMLLAAQIYEENLFVNGTGTNQAQGLVGNVGAGVTGVAAGSDNYASELLAATFDVQSTLKTAYHQNAGWLMSRATATVIKKQQSQTNLYTPVWTRENGKDYLHGYPVTFSTAMPSIATGHTPLMFGDFGTGYVIGDRGGSGLNVKILDQPKAVEGILQFLCYRRSDGRIRRSEAIQAITLA